MPKRRNGRDDRLAKLIDDTIGQLVTAVRAEVRRSVAEELTDYLHGGVGGGGGVSSVGRVGRRAGGGAGKVAKRVTPCIAPNCNNPSKGPRFHYLCEKHKDAKKSEYEAWRKAAKEKQAA